MKEGSTCALSNPNSTKFTVSSEIEIISNGFAEIKVNQPENWMYAESQYKVFDVICNFQKRSQNATEQRTTRPVRGGGNSDQFVYGGGIGVVNSNDIKINNVSVKWKHSPMTYDVSYLNTFIRT